MQEILHAILAFLQQGITAIFRFFDLIYTWAFDQVMRLTAVPFHSWMLWKQILFIIAAIVVVGLLFRAGKLLWEAAERILEAFAVLFRALVEVLPWILGAGIVAFVTLAIINNVTF